MNCKRGARRLPAAEVEGDTPRPLRAVGPKYSAMKKRAYLKAGVHRCRWPAMSSLSASGRSKGERLDSARAATRKMTKPAKPQRREHVPVRE